jgi:hypothetical protein
MTLIEAVSIAAYFSLSALVLPISVGIITWKTQLKNFKIFSVGLLIIFLLILCSAITVQFNIENNLFLDYIIFTTDCIIYGWVFSYAFKRVVVRRLIFLGCGLVILLAIGEVIATAGGKTLSFYASMSKNVFIIVLMAYFLVALIKSPSINNLTTIPLFWVSCIKLFIASFSIVSENFQSFMMKNGFNDALYTAILIMFVFQAICNLLYVVPIWKASTQPLHISDVKI